MVPIETLFDLLLINYDSKIILKLRNAVEARNRRKSFEISYKY